MILFVAPVGDFLATQLAPVSPRSYYETTRKNEWAEPPTIGCPLTESIGGSIHFMTTLEDSTGFIMATPIKTTQSPVVTSSAEAVYVAAAMATREALWLRKLLSALGVDGGLVAMGEDNQSCLALVINPKATGRTKHIDVAYHMVRDYQARGDVAFYFFPSADMPADGLTKPLPSPAFTAFWAAVVVGEVLGAVARGAELGDPLLGEC